MVSMRFEGGKELAAELARLSTRLSKSILREALTEAAEPMRKSASSHAPRRAPAPDIADNIVISTAKTEDQASVAMGPAKGFAYGLPLEVGTVKMPARPFMRPAFDGNVERAVTITGEVLWRELAGRGAIRTVTAATDVDAPDGGDVL